MRNKTIKPPVKSDSPFTVNIVQSDHQLITVKHDGKSYTKTFTIPAGKVLNYKSYIALTDDDGYYVGRIKEAIDLASNSTTISASEARPIIHTVTVEQYQLQDINVRLTDPGNIIRFEDETTSYSFTAEDKTKYTSDCSTRLVNYDPGTSDHPGPGDIQENFTIAAETNPQRNENVQVLIYQSPHQTITVDYKGTKHTEPFIIKRRDIVSASIEAEEGYKPGLLNRTKVRATNFDNIVFKASAAGKAKKKIRIRQKRHQTITAVYRGKTFETTFEAYLGDKIQFSVEANPGWTAGVLNVDADYTVAGLEPLEVTVSDAEPVMYTVTPIQTPHQTIYIKYGDVRSSTPVRVPSGTRVEFEIVPEVGYNAGTLNKLSAVVDGVNITVSATPAEIKKYNLNIVFDPEAHTTLKVTKDGTVFGTYTENTTLKFQYGTVLTFALTMEEGYTETRNPNSITMNKDNTLIIQGTSKKQFTITLTQTDNQTIYAMYKGVKKTESFVVEYGDSCTFGIETSDPESINVGNLDTYELHYIKENKTVTATPASYKPINLTEYVMRKYPLGESTDYRDIQVGLAPVSTGILYYKTINRLREKDFQVAENAKNIIAADSAFKNARLLTEFPVIKLKNNINDISYIFAGCVKLTGDELKRNLSVWNLSGPLNMSHAFFFDSNLDYIDMAPFKNSSITDMTYLFSEDPNLVTISNTRDLNISECTSLLSTFENCQKLTSIDVSKWNTSKVRSIGAMFSKCYLLENIDVSKWDVSKVGYMPNAFNFCSKLKSLDVSKWDTSSLETMVYIFNNCSSLQSLDVSKWNTSKVTDMSGVFNICRSLTTLDVSKWDTSKCTGMYNMFASCSSLQSLDLSRWDVSKVKVMTYMFHNNSKLTNIGDVSKWNTSSCINTNYMFNNCTSLENIDVSKWDTSKIENMGIMFCNCSSFTSLDLSKWKTGNVKAMPQLVSGCKNLTTIGDVSKWDTSKVTDMRATFGGCQKLQSIDVSKWNTSSATDMSFMFYLCRTLTTIDISKWDTSKVIKFNNIFDGCDNLQSVGNLSNLNLNNAIDIAFAFNRCEKITELDVSNWGLRKIDSMYALFNNCPNLREIHGIENWNLSSARNMNSMFYGCKSLVSLNISGWDTSNVKFMNNMFGGCESLTTITGILDFRSCTTYENMFNDCLKLTSVKVKNLPTDIDTFCRGARIDKSKVTVVS